MNGAIEMAHNYAYMRIYADLADRIHDGRLEPGAKLPTETELVKAYAVSRETIRKALSLLEAQDLITRKEPALRAEGELYEVSSFFAFKNMFLARYPECRNIYKVEKKIKEFEERQKNKE